MEKNNDLILQFYADLESAVENEVLSIADKVNNAWFIGNNDMSRIVIKYLWGIGTTLRNQYLLSHGSNIVLDEFMNKIKTMAFGKYSIDTSIIMRNNLWSSLLGKVQNRILFFISSKRMLEYMRPILCSMKTEYIVLTMCDIPFFNELPSCATVICFEFSNKRVYHNGLLARHLPNFYLYANTIGNYIESLSPRLLVCIDGCQLEYGLAALICKAHGVPSVCIQQGWPSFLHEGFHNKPYTHFLTWGKGFSKLWEKRNANVNFLDVGYLYKVKNNSTHNAITFFLQAPVYFLTEDYLNRMYALICKTAEKYKECMVFVREHPVYNVDDKTRKEWQKHKNLKVVSDIPLADVYAKTRVAVSCFSSSIMECVVHGCTPLVFCPTTGVRYNPDIELEGIGMISDCEETFFSKLATIMNDLFEFRPLHPIEYWFKSVGENSIAAAIDNIEKLAN